MQNKSASYWVVLIVAGIAVAFAAHFAWLKYKAHAVKIFDDVQQQLDPSAPKKRGP
jgi:hypothetical protein